LKINMSIQHVLSRVLITAILLASTATTTIHAFSTLPWINTMAISRTERSTYFASAPVVFMSETTEAGADVVAAAAAAAAVEVDVASDASQMEMTEGERAAKRKVQRDRHTLFIGNLPYGMLRSLVLCFF
jgi:hypothetical protein